MNQPIILSIIVLNVVVSLLGFSNRAFFDRYKFSITQIKNEKQWDRFLASGFLHVDYIHLFFNMLTLYIFSPYAVVFLGYTAFVVVYLLALIGGNALTYFMNHKNMYYNAVGASGAVTGILFTTITLFPDLPIAFLFIPIPIPGYIFGLLYLAYSLFGMSRQEQDGIGHSAHLGGALVGIIACLILSPNSLIEHAWKIALMFLPLILYFVQKFALQKR